MKTCSGEDSCGLEKEDKEFYKGRKKCKACYNKRQNKKYAENKSVIEKVKGKEKEEVEEFKRKLDEGEEGELLKLVKNLTLEINEIKDDKNKRELKNAQTQTDAVSHEDVGELFRFMKTVTSELSAIREEHTVMREEMSMLMGEMARVQNKLTGLQGAIRDTPKASPTVPSFVRELAEEKKKEREKRQGHLYRR
jgi:hypothetical protein